MADARSVITAMARIEVSGSPKRITIEQGEQIAALFEGDIALFMELDERPYAYEQYAPVDDWHFKLRQARNSTPRFFELLSTREGAQS